MKVAIKNKNEWKYIDAEDIMFNGERLGEIFARLDALHMAYDKLTNELKNCHVVPKDTQYIIQIDNELKRINDLKLFESIETKLPLRFYKVENNKIVEDKNKIGALL